MSISSKWPLASSSGLPSRNSISPLLLAPETLLDIDELLGRDREKHQLAGEVLGGLGVGQPHRGAEHAGDLRVVAAAVRRAGVRVGERVVGGAQAVELADKGEARARLCRRRCGP